MVSIDKSFNNEGQQQFFSLNNHVRERMFKHGYGSQANVDRRTIEEFSFWREKNEGVEEKDGNRYPDGQH
jgi:hypothetical protein